jgi:hypothetical protein
MLIDSEYYLSIQGSEWILFSLVFYTTSEDGEQLKWYWNIAVYG